MLSLRDVRFGFPGRPDFLGPISLTVMPGQCWAIVGPNGAGKTTLLRLMAGLARPSQGEVTLGGDDLRRLARRQRARQIAYVSQRSPADLDMRVRDVVLLGRYPFRSMGLFESPEDHHVADQAMATTQTLPFADRPVVTLSGGETQRVHLAAAIAQQPRVLLLDEPTASLDLKHQLVVFRIVRDRTDHEGLAAVVVSHDVNLAARFCTHVLLLDGGRPAAVGAPAEVLTPTVLEPVYGLRLTTVSVPDRPHSLWIVPVDDAPVEVA